MNTCGTCKYRGDNADKPYGLPDEDHVESSYFLCTRIKMVRHWEYPPGQKALVKDGSGYYAALCVEDDFGCNLWEGT